MQPLAVGVGVSRAAAHRDRLVFGVSVGRRTRMAPRHMPFRGHLRHPFNDDAGRKQVHRVCTR